MIKILHGESKFHRNDLQSNFIFIRIDDDSTSDESNQTSSSESDDRSTTTKKRNVKISVTFLESLSNYVPLEDKHPDAKQ